MLKNENKKFSYINQNFNQTNTSHFDSTNYNFKTISSDMKKYNPSSTLPAFSDFKGFYNKKFNLTNYKVERENSRSRSRSPERIYQEHKPRGNGIPTDALDRIIYLGNILKKDTFQKYYSTRPQRKTAEINDVCDFIIKFRKTHSELESVMMAFYFVCHEIKYDGNYFQLIHNENNIIKKQKKIKKLLVLD